MSNLSVFALRGLRNVSMVLFTGVVAVACAGAASSDSDGEEQAGVAASALTVCGGGCPTGYHPTSFSCSPGCAGSCFGGTNSATCELDQGTSFTTCGLACPSGYHQTSVSCTSTCGGSCFGGNNASTCVLDSGPTFFACGGCPSGYHSTSSFCALQCGVGPLGCSNVNADNCAANTSPCSLAEGPTNVAVGGRYDFTISSTSAIPPGFSSFWFGTKNGVTDAVRVPTGGTTGSFVFTNAAGIDGNYTRQVQFQNAAGNIFCTTNSVNTNLLR